MTPEPSRTDDKLSPLWKSGVFVALVIGFTVLIWIAFRVYHEAPPIPEKIVDTSGQVVFTGEDIMAGQQVFLKYGLMENGTIWGHGAYLGPDFSARYLHTLALTAIRKRSQEVFHRDPEALTAPERDAVTGDIARALKMNRYDATTGILTYTDFEAASYADQIGGWTDYFSHPALNGGLPAKYIGDAKALRQLTAFFAWTAWASIANGYWHARGLDYTSQPGTCADYRVVPAARRSGLYPVGRYPAGSCDCPDISAHEKGRSVSHSEHTGSGVAPTPRKKSKYGNRVFANRRGKSVLPPFLESPGQIRSGLNTQYSSGVTVSFMQN